MAYLFRATGRSIICQATSDIPWVPEAFHAQFPVSVKTKISDPRVFSRGLATCVFGLRPKKDRPAADDVPRRTRGKNLWYPGYV